MGSQSCKTLSSLAWISTTNRLISQDMACAAKLHSVASRPSLQKDYLNDQLSPRSSSFGQPQDPSSPIIPTIPSPYRTSRKKTCTQSPACSLCKLGRRLFPSPHILSPSSPIPPWTSYSSSPRRPHVGVCSRLHGSPSTW